MEKEILRVIALIMESNLYQQVYASELKMLFEMLRRQQSTYLQGAGPSCINPSVK